MTYQNTRPQQHLGQDNLWGYLVVVLLPRNIQVCIYKVGAQVHPRTKCNDIPNTTQNTYNIILPTKFHYYVLRYTIRGRNVASRQTKQIYTTLQYAVVDTNNYKDAKKNKDLCRNIYRFLFLIFKCGIQNKSQVANSHDKHPLFVSLVLPLSSVSLPAT